MKAFRVWRMYKFCLNPSGGVFIQMGKWRGEIWLIEGRGAVVADFKVISEYSIYLARVHII